MVINLELSTWTISPNLHEFHSYLNGVSFIDYEVNIAWAKICDEERSEYDILSLYFESLIISMDSGYILEFLLIIAF